MGGLGAILLMVFLIGCGGSGTPASNPETGPALQEDPLPIPSTALAQLFFKSGSLSRIDPADPSALPLLVDPGNTAHEFGIIERTFDAANQEIKDQRVRTILYTKDDGKFYKLGTLKGDSQSPAQVSSESGAASICSSEAETDTADHAQSILLYELPGVDGNCTTKGDNLWKMLRLAMNAGDAPLPGKKVISTLLSKATGGIVGFLAIDGANLVRCDLNLQNCTSLIVLSTGAAELEYNPFSGFLILLADDKLYSYSIDTGLLSSSRYTFALSPALISTQRDATHVYFADGLKLLKLPLDGSANASLLTTESGTIGTIKLTINKVVYLSHSVSGPDTDTLKAIAKNGGAPVALLPATTDAVFLVATAADFVYYNSIAASIFSSGAIKEDQTAGVNRSNALWISVIFRSSFSAASGFQLIDKILRLEGCAFTTCANGTLLSTDAATHSGDLILGNVPMDIVTFSFNGLANGALGTGTDSGNGNQRDLFYIKADQADSLIRITTTPTKSEFGIPFF